MRVSNALQRHRCTVAEVTPGLRTWMTCWWPKWSTLNKFSDY